MIIGSISARTTWRPTRALFERYYIAKLISVPSEMSQLIVFAGVLQIVIALCLASTIGLLAGSLLSRKTLVVDDGKSL